MTETPRQKAEQLAVEKWPPNGPGPALPIRDGFRNAFIDGYLTRAAEAVTVSHSTQAMAVSGLMNGWNLCGDDAGCLCEDAKDFAWEIVQGVYRSAGFTVEGGE